VVGGVGVTGVVAYHPHRVRDDGAAGALRQGYALAAAGAALKLWCYTCAMPTTRPRHIITETDEIARALDEAAKRWPEDSGNRARLLARLVREGYQVVIRQRERDAQDRRDAVARTSGALTGVYGPGYLDELRQDWPE
jgi:hypothetical protein